MEYDHVDDPHLQNHVLHLKNESTVHEDLDSLSWLHHHQDSSSSPSLHGSASSMVNFEDVNNSTQKHTFIKKMNNAAAKKRIRSSEEETLFDDDVSFSHKKRRLSTDQVRFLEKSFEVDNKLEPDRKLQLAKELGLQPRQVAIWFQNRRARYKTKVLEKDYDVLKSNYDRLKRDFDALYSENEKLKNEVNMLTEKLLLDKENEEHQLEKSEPCDHNSINTQSDNVDVKQLSKSSSAKSDVLNDSDSPRYATTTNHGNRSRVLELEPGDSSHAFEADTNINSDYEDDEESLSKSLFIHFPKLEEVDQSCYDDHLLQPNSCNSLGYPVQNHGTWFWQV